MSTDLDALVAGFGDRVRRLEDLRGDDSFEADREVLHDVAAKLKEAGFDFLVLITAADNYLDEPRFAVTYRFRSLGENRDVRVNAPVPGEESSIASVTDLFEAANWLEREVWDMFGVKFQGHPNLERILMWEGFEGHPLRKDYPLLGNTPGTPGHVGKGGKQ